MPWSDDPQKAQEVRARPKADTQPPPGVQSPQILMDSFAGRKHHKHCSFFFLFFKICSFRWAPHTAENLSTSDKLHSPQLRRATTCTQNRRPAPSLLPPRGRPMSGRECHILPPPAASRTRGCAFTCAKPAQSPPLLQEKEKASKWLSNVPYHSKNNFLHETRATGVRLWGTSGIILPIRETGSFGRGLSWGRAILLSEDPLDGFFSPGAKRLP